MPFAHERPAHAVEGAAPARARTRRCCRASPRSLPAAPDAREEQVGVFDRAVAVVVLGMHADDRGLDAQVDVLGHQRDARPAAAPSAVRACSRASRCRRRGRGGCPAGRPRAASSGRRGGLMAASCRDCRSGRPAARGRGRSASLVAFAISSSRKRLTWRTLRAASERPFLPASSSSSTIIGMKMSCSSKRNTAAGSCISTFVSSTNTRRAARSFGRLPCLLQRCGVRVRAPRRALPAHGPPPDLAPFVPQTPRGVDQERAALDAHELASVHVLLLPSRRTALQTCWSSSRAARTETSSCP